MTPNTVVAAKKLVILYGIGGLSDVGRHAILAALEQPVTIVKSITIVTEYPELLDEKNWECNCFPEGGHANPMKQPEHQSRLTMVSIDSWKNPQKDLAQHFQGSDAVISCLGHRQPGYKYPQLIKRGLIASEGNQQIIAAMNEAKDCGKRAVVISSIGIQEDWPPMEYHWAGKIMKLLFKTNTKRAFKDLTQMEQAYQKSDLDYLFVRPVGISEDAVPVNEWCLQKQKGKDGVGMNMAKMDVARFMVLEALDSTLHRQGVVIGPGEGK